MRCSLFLTVLTLLVYSPSLFSRQLAIVIDDLGYSFVNGKRSIDLPGKVTVAILPFAPNSVELAEYATRKNKEAIIHLPMQAKSETNQKTESPTLNVTMSTIQYKIILETTISRFQKAKAEKNHISRIKNKRKNPKSQVL